MSRTLAQLLALRHAWWAPMVLIGLAIFAARLGYLGYLSPYGLAPDEAQYWTWLQNNDWSFLTKPPLTTWLIGLSTAVLGDTLVGVKFFALLGQWAVPLLGAALARLLVAPTQQAAAGWWAFGLLTTLPLVAAGGLIMAPDAVLLPLYLFALVQLVRALEVPERRGLCWARWVLMGGVVGLAGLAKYSAALFFPLLGVFLLWRKRAWLLKPQPYVAGLIALALQAPVLIWNVQNDWLGVHHVLWQADSGDARHGGLETLLEFLGGQALVLGPLGLGVLVAAWVGFGRTFRQLPERMALLVVFTLPVFLLFLGQTFTSKVQANWPLLATVPALPLAAVWLAQIQQQGRLVGLWRGIIVAGLVLNAALSLALYNTQALRPLLPLKADPTKDLLGWADMGELLGWTLRELDDPLVLGVRYQTLAQVAFHTPAPDGGRLDWFYWNAEGRRMVDYDDWLWPQSLPNRPVVLVKESPDFPIHVTELFTECRPWHSLATEQRGEVVRRLSTWVCWGYRV